VGKAESKAAEDRAAVRRYVTLPLAQLLPDLTRPAFRKRSPAGATLMAEWVAIVGPQLGAITAPLRLTRGQLTIACAGPVAMELQHLQSALIDRINLHAGQRLVERLRFVQNHLAPAAAPSPPRRDVPLEAIDGIGDGPLADALAALQQAMRSAR